MKSSSVRFGSFLSANGGKVSGKIAGIPVSAPVEVLTDRLGIPHIFAENESDLATVQGFVHAQDRLWQMDFQRRFAAGRLARVVGGRALAHGRL